MKGSRSTEVFQRFLILGFRSTFSVYVLELLIRIESELPKSRYVDFRLLVYYTEKHLYDYKSQRFNKYNLQSYLVLSVKENLDGVISMDCDFVKVLHPCKSVAYLGSWILNIYIYWKFGVGNIRINTFTAFVLNDLRSYIDRTPIS